MVRVPRGAFDEDVIDTAGVVTLLERLFILNRITSARVAIG
jgi:hypothetical protein